MKGLTLHIKFLKGNLLRLSSLVLTVQKTSLTGLFSFTFVDGSQRQAKPWMVTYLCTALKRLLLKSKYQHNKFRM